VKEKFKKILFFTLTVGLVVSVALTIKSLLLLRIIPDVEDKTQFAKNFNYQEWIATELDKCIDWSDLLYASCVKSPLFPYKKLEIKQIKQDVVNIIYEKGKETNLSTEGIWLLTDPVWNIFFVARSKYPESLKYYGPYR